MVCISKPTSWSLSQSLEIPSVYEQVLTTDHHKKFICNLQFTKLPTLLSKTFPIYNTGQNTLGQSCKLIIIIDLGITLKSIAIYNSVTVPSSPTQYNVESQKKIQVHVFYIIGGVGGRVGHV